MNTLDFASLLSSLTSGTLDADYASYEVDRHRRLADARSKIGTSATGVRDLAVLMRMVMRARDEIAGQVLPIRVPTGDGWPSPAEWAEHSVEAIADQRDNLTLWARPWEPEWLTVVQQPPDRPVFRADHREELRRPDLRVPADPMLIDALGPDFSYYTSDGQKAAIRAIMASPPGATIVVDLPTGTGKSAVAFAPARLLRKQGVGITISVVPTVTLALDQARQYGQISGESGPWAWIGGQPAEERLRIVSAIRDGSQTILFTSPEALKESPSLARAIRYATERGFLKLLVIDEAHLVSQWGTDFRPSFQYIAGLRRQLLKTAQSLGREAFRTLALSATLTEETASTFSLLFSQPGPLVHVAANALRPEPNYWSAFCSSEDERNVRLLDALANLPRPALVYTLRKNHARRIATLLHRSGYARVATVTGDTDSAARLVAMQQLRGDEVLPTVDTVVATSAFGLGIDQPNIRTVIHACIPETVDRFYQEVGRSGRDGKPSISLVLHTPADLPAARHINRRMVIGTEKGLGRWKDMHDASVDGGDDTLLVSLRTVPSWVNVNSDENELWNIRTLTLMARSGLIRIELQDLPSRESGESEAAWEERRTEAYDQYYSTARVRIVQATHRSEYAWTTFVEGERQRLKRADESNLRLMRQILSRGTRVCDLLQHSYKRTIGDRTVLPALSCTDCDACRDQSPMAGHPTATASWEGVQVLPSAQLRLRAAGGARLVVYYTHPTSVKQFRRWTRDIDGLIEKAVKHGVRLLVIPPELRDHRAVNTAHNISTDGYIFVESTQPPPLLSAFPRVPMLVIASDYANTPLPKHWVTTPPDAAIRIITVPSNTRDPVKPHLTLAESYAPSMEISTFLSQF